MKNADPDTALIAFVLVFDYVERFTGGVEGDWPIAPQPFERNERGTGRRGVRVMNAQNLAERPTVEVTRHRIDCELQEGGSVRVHVWQAGFHGGAVAVACVGPHHVAVDIPVEVAEPIEDSVKGEDAGHV